jgi:hypothetical protein
MGMGFKARIEVGMGLLFRGRNQKVGVGLVRYLGRFI